MKRKQQANSVAADLRKQKDRMTDIPTPEGLDEFTTERQRQLWWQYSHSRALEYWSDDALVDLHKIVNLSVDVEEMRRQISQEGFIVDGAEHPLIKTVTTYEKLIMSLKRVLGLVVHANKAPALANSGSNNAADKQPQKKKKEDDNILSLLA